MKKIINGFKKYWIGIISYILWLICLTLIIKSYWFYIPSIIFLIIGYKAGIYYIKKHKIK